MYSLEEALHSQHQDWKIPKFIMDTRYQLHIYKNMGLYLKKKYTNIMQTIKQKTCKQM